MPAYKQISLKMSKETHEKIMDRYAKCPYAISLNKFIVQCAAEYDPVILLYNYDAIRRHTDEVLETKDKLYPVIAMLTATDQAFPKDIEIIISCLESLVESEKKLLNDNFKERERMRKLVKNELKSIKN